MGKAQFYGNEPKGEDWYQLDVIQDEDSRPWAIWTKCDPKDEFFAFKLIHDSSTEALDKANYWLTYKTKAKGFVVNKDILLLKAHRADLFAILSKTIKELY